MRGRRVRCNAMLASRGTAAEANDVAVRILDIEVFRTPCGRGERFKNRYAGGGALLVERFDAVDACRRIEVLVIAPVPTLRLISGRLLQMQLQPVETADAVEIAPRFAEDETEPPVVGHRALEILDEELRSERCHTRLHGSCHRSSFRLANGRAFSGEPSERSERPERMRGRRVRCNAMLGGAWLPRSARSLIA